eukprot:1241617-Amorphochlora_amoeboformis.AAC.2
MEGIRRRRVLRASPGDIQRKEREKVKGTALGLMLFFILLFGGIILIYKPKKSPTDSDTASVSAPNLEERVKKAAEWASARMRRGGGKVGAISQPSPSPAISAGTGEEQPQIIQPDPNNLQPPVEIPSVIMGEDILFGDISHIKNMLKPKCRFMERESGYIGNCPENG